MFGSRTIAVSLAAAGLLASAAAPATAAVTGPDSAVSITSGAPVPGLMTAGTFTISSVGSAPVAAGARYKVTFQDMRGTASLSTHTVTCPILWNCSAAKDPSDYNSYIITLKKSLPAGQSVSGLWSNNHFFNGTRDRVTIQRLSGTADVSPANDTAVYDNARVGF